jgi:hypothetical protein
MNAQPILLVIAAAALATLPARAQSVDRRAMLTGGGPGYGRCNGEVVVDGVAEIEIRGDLGTLRNISGRQPEWRRFECTSPIPATAADIQFSGEGRGTERLVRTPYDNNGVAVIHIEDSDPGAHAYRFVLSWDGAAAPPTEAAVPPAQGRFGADQAVQLCEDAIRREAIQRFGARQIVLRGIHRDDNPGRSDWLVGTLEIHRPDATDEHRRFSCSVDFDNGRLRSANIEEPEGRSGAGRDRTAR